MNNRILPVLALALAAASAPHAFGHGIGFDTIPSIVVDDREISVTIDIPSYYDETDERQVTISAADRQSRENIPNVTYLVGLFHDGEMIFRNYFFAGDGIVSMNVKNSGDDGITIHGVQDKLLGAWRSSAEQPLEITGPVFASDGLYTFEIELRTIDEPSNVVEGLGVYTADITIVEVAEFLEKDAEEADVKFRTKSYFDSIESFNYDPATKQVTLEMPFDWSEKQISHIPVVHVEVHFPKDFQEFLTPGYEGQVNGIELFKSSISVDDYTEDDERVVHFVLLKDHIRHVKNQLRQLGEPAGDSMTFTLQTGEGVDFPVSAWTRDESYQVDLSWDPVTVLPDQKTKFVFTIRDAATAEPLRHSGFDFVILQGGKEIHRESGNAQVGGDFVDHTFAGDQTGPTVIRFEDIRGSGLSTEFGIVVAPESGVVASLGQEAPPATGPPANGDDNGCLIATAAFGSEMAGEVQMLRELRDHSLLATQSGTAFMAGFNQVYYSFSPTVADWERQSPAFREAVKIGVTPLLWSLSVLSHVGMDSEAEVLGYGIGVVALNLGMYVGLPLAGVVRLCRIRKN